MTPFRNVEPKAMYKILIVAFLRKADTSVRSLDDLNK